MASKSGEFLKFLLVVQILFGFFITTTLYVLPADAKYFINPFTGEWDQAAAEDQVDLTEETVASLKSTNWAVQAIGIVQTGVYVIDLFINSLFAIPQMITIFFSGVFSFAPISPYLQATISVAILAICIISYFLILIGFLTSIRSGTVV